MEEVLVDLCELNFDQMKQLYSQLKRLDDNGSSRETGEDIDIDTIAVADISATFENSTIASLFTVNTTEPVSIRDYASRVNLPKKSILEIVLDTVFAPTAFDMNAKLNFGALFREYFLTSVDIDQVRDHLSNSAVVNVRSLLTEFFYVASEVEILLAFLYSRITDEAFREQYNSADHIPLLNITQDQYDSLADEFDAAFEPLLEKHLEARVSSASENSLQSCEASLSTAVAEANAMCEAMESGMDSLLETFDNYKKEIAAKAIKPIEEEVTVIDDSDFGKPASVVNVQQNDIAARYGECSYSNQRYPPRRNVEVLPRLPPMAHLISAPEPTLTSTDILEVEKVRVELPLSHDRPTALQPPAVGDQCLAKRGSEWKSARFEGFNLSRRAIVMFGDDSSTVTVSESEVAFSAPPSWFMAVGDRVVVPFQRNKSESVWLSTIVAEIPSLSRNNGRYLVFNDYGDARYVSYTDIRCLWRSPSLDGIWAEIEDLEVRDFLKQLIYSLPEKALVRLKSGENVRVVDERGKWQNCVVEEVDGLMARLRYPDWRCRWFYRGDRRLELIHQQRAKARTQASGQRTFTRRSRHAGPVIEYVDDSSEDEVVETQVEFDNGQRRIQTARKRSSRRGQIMSAHGGSSSAFESRPMFERLRKKELINMVLKTMPKVESNEDMPSRRSASCDETCLVLNYEMKEFSNQNPRMIPMLCGWQREIETARTRSRVVYISPCNHRRLRQEKELQDYLMKTNCKLTIDLFSFDLDLIPNRTIQVIDPFVRIADLTNGCENTRIECVNGFTREEPLMIHYESRRFTTDPDVDLEGAKQFISGCDCTDNCADPRKCHCQGLTTLQATVAGRGNKNKVVGYRFRRLPDGQIKTGIYECNDTCGCDYRCQNRVVQQPLMNQLQLFQTYSKGWGVRALDDIPKGAFICVYAGNVMSDARANEIGQREGDEYFAELDLIDCAERHKEGYEPETITLDGDSTSDDTTDGADVNLKRRRMEEDWKMEDDFDDETSRSSRGLGVYRRVEKPWQISEYLGENNVFILDAKTSGNIGRYLNHSCSPNVFVQNVFVDTHDLRLPWVAFFSSELIQAGTELVWDYSYTPMDDRPILCRCGAPNCRKRLISEIECQIEKKSGNLGTAVMRRWASPSAGKNICRVRFSENQITFVE